MSNNNPIDPQKFKSLQRQDWNRVAEGWKKWWKTIEDSTQVVSDKLVELAQIQQGHKVLDIATGVGEPAVTAAKKVSPSGKVTAIDISPQMLAVAKERAAANGLDNIMEFKEADAESLVLPDSSFNAITSRFGLMFLPNLPDALKKMRGRLVSDGRIAAAVWSSPPKVPFISVPFSIILKEIGASPPLAGSTGPFSLADTDVLYDKFKQADYQDIRIEKGAVNFRFNSPEEFTAFNKATVSPAASMMSGQSTARQAEIWDAVTEAARKQADPSTGAVSFVNEVIYITAKR